MRNRLPLALLCLCSALTLGIDCSNGYEAGESGAAEFMTNFNGAVLPSGGAKVGVGVRPAGGQGCGLDAPQITWRSVRSSNPEVATFELRPGQVDVTTGKAGIARLELLDAAGALVDSLPIEVDDVGSIALTGSWLAATPIILDNTPIVSLPYSLVGKSGKPVLEVVDPTNGGGGATVEAGGTISREGDSGSWYGTPGEGWFIIKAGGVEKKVDVTVVPSAAVIAAKVTGQLVTRESCDASERCQYFGVVSVVASTAQGNVYGPKCLWTSSMPTAVEVVSQEVMPAFSGAPGENTRFLMRHSGPIDVICQIGGVQATTVLRLTN